VNEALAALHTDFEAIYAGGVGRPSIPPERLLRALLLQAFYGIRSERLIMERLEFDLLFRWFVGLGIDDAAWDQTTFSKNRERLLDGDVAHKFLAAVLAHPKVKRLLSTEPFSVDGTMIEAWAFMKSVRPKDGSGEPPDPARNGEADFHGERRTNDTHQSTTDPDARLYRKGAGREAKLGFIGHALMENRNGLVVDACLTRADGHAERVAALHMIETRADRPRRITLGADKGYDVEDFVNELRSVNVAPHVAAKARGSAIDGRTTRHAGYRISQVIRKRIDEVFGWGQGRGRPAQDPTSRARPRRLAVHLHLSRVQPDQAAPAAESNRVSRLLRSHYRRSAWNRPRPNRAEAGLFLHPASPCPPTLFSTASTLSMKRAPRAAKLLTTRSHPS
jgi:transposase